MTEAELLRRVLIRSSEKGMRLFRNTIGRYLLADGRWLTSGLCVGSSDLIGWTPVKITRDMVGQTLAVFTAIETKAKGKKATGAQNNFIGAVVHDGGIAKVAHSVEDL